MKRDIETGEDIRMLVDAFYKKVVKDPLIVFVFTDIVRVNWENHLPIMYSFWENILFFTLFSPSSTIPFAFLSKSILINSNYLLK